ncbi:MULTISPECIES: class I SAM-dependent methyltransferase [Sinorhizobium]|uniref:class I SAM-dependent methyltransferase n=1 Tax=Sinorhizobium TaxID=28105 RepID=UPI000BE8BD9C|nr:MULTISPECIES: class I SAM-dependent methyltransferase [Sinorhizobium]PDT53517.1 methyltransferase [Sinorhizobium sp. NG07B]POH29683.1 methyltransferase [Sinorhizobium americanum]
MQETMQDLTLDELAIRFGTDKSSKHHNYTRVYQSEFASRRQTTRGVIEIGIGGQTYKGTAGASLRMWAEYFSNANVVGIDIDPSTEANYGERIHAVIGDQTRRSVLDKAIGLVPSVDVVIDDGAHQNNLTIATFEYLFQYLRPGGVYVIEDTLCSGEQQFSNVRSEMESFVVNILRNIETNGRILTKRNNADFRKIPSDFVMNVYEKWVESITIYRGLYFIRKRSRSTAQAVEA